MLAGNFKEEITDKENPKDQSELLASDGQLFVHRQRGKPNVDAVEEGNDVKKKNERNDPNLHFPNGFPTCRGPGAHRLPRLYAPNGNYSSVSAQL